MTLRSRISAYMLSRRTFLKICLAATGVAVGRVQEPQATTHAQTTSLIRPYGSGGYGRGPYGKT